MGRRARAKEVARKDGGSTRRTEQYPEYRSSPRFHPRKGRSPDSKAKAHSASTKATVRRGVTRRL